MAPDLPGDYCPGTLPVARENDYNTRGVHIGNGQGLGFLAGLRDLTGKIREDNSLKILHRFLV